MALSVGAASVVADEDREMGRRRFGVSIASAVRWVARFQVTGRSRRGDRRSDRVEAHGDYLLGE